jgi:hypothetical protein
MDRQLHNCEIDIIINTSVRTITTSDNKSHTQSADHPSASHIRGRSELHSTRHTVCSVGQEVMWGGLTKLRAEDAGLACPAHIPPALGCEGRPHSTFPCRGTQCGSALGLVPARTPERSAPVMFDDTCIEYTHLPGDRHPSL